MNTHERTTDKIRPEQSTKGSIMVAVSGGASGWPALAWAAAEAWAHHSELRITDAIPRARGGLSLVVGRGRAQRPGGRSVAPAVLRLAQGPIAIIRTPTTSKPKADS